MIQFWSENIIFFMLTQSDTTLIQASMTYCVNIIGALFYLLPETVNLVTTFFVFLISLFLIFFINFSILSISFFWYSILISRFFCIYIFDMLVAFQDFPDTLLFNTKFLMFDIPDICLFYTVLLIIFIGYCISFLLWIIMIFSFFSIQISLPSCR